MIKTKKTRLLALLATGALVVAACGGSDDDNADGDSADTTVADSGDGGDDGDDTGDDADDSADTTVADDGDDGDDGDDSGDDGDDAPATTAPAPEEVPSSGNCEATVAGTQINYGIFAPNAAFDPIGSSGALVGGTELAAVYDVLFRFDPVAGEVVPHLAESLVANTDDFTDWTLTLREGITFSDGTPLDAQMLSDNIDRFFLPEGVRNTSAGFLQYIDTKEVVDELSLHMVLNTPFAEFGLVFADEPGMVVNLNAIGEDLDAFRVQPPDAAGVGPYTVERNVPGEETIFTARADYWGGPVCVETLRFVWVPGSAGTYAAYQSGDLDMTFLRDPIVNAQAIADGNEGFFFNQDGGAMINYNHREGHPTADIRVREAISLAIDPQIINDRAFQGQLEVTKSYFGPSSRYLSDAVVPYPTDPERAAALVAEVIAEGEWDGSISYVAGSDGTGPDTALAIEGMLGAIGITVNTEQMPTGESIARLGAGEFDIIGNGFNSGPGTAVLSLVRNLSSTSPTNRMGYSSPAMDELINEALATPFAELQPVMARINDQLNADSAAVTYGASSEGAVWNDDIVGVVPTVSSIFLFHAASIDG